MYDLVDRCVQEAEYKRKLKAKRKQRDGLEADLMGPGPHGGGGGGGRNSRGRARRGRTDSGTALQCYLLQLLQPSSFLTPLRFLQISRGSGDA